MKTSFASLPTQAAVTEEPWPPTPPVLGAHEPVAAGRVPWPLLVGFTLVFLLFWLAPPLEGLKQSARFFPVALHTVMETMAIVVALLVFAVCWHAHDTPRASGLTVLGAGFLAVGLLDLAHMLSYKGMPDFVTPASPEKAIDFWLMARYASALTLLAVALRPWRQRLESIPRGGLLALVLGGVALACLLRLLHPELFPRTFIDGQGLTAFKIASEYGIVALLLVPAAVFLRDWRRGADYDAGSLFTAVVITILCELCFTLYSNVNSLFSLLGHTYKVIAYAYLYRALVVAGVQAPYEQLNREIGIRREAEERSEFLAYHDALTRLPNRRLAADRFRGAAAQGQRSGSRVALLFIDLDNFKAINDSLGHLYGDVLLTATARRLVESVRGIDTVSRQGGDEFLILLTDVGDAESLTPLIERLLERIQEPCRHEGHELISCASIGVALYPDDGEDFDTLLKKADMAMYRAKGAGRNTFRFFDTHMDAEVEERLRLRNGLHRALDAGTLLLHYQPVVNLATGAMEGVEALIRWRGEDGQFIPPARFIPVAEESGLIVSIGDWVLGEACRQAARWHADGHTGMKVAVNLSALQFRRGDVERSVVEALRKSGLPGHALTLELTESILISDTEQVLSVIRNLKRLGVRLAIDDFGTGYSSLSYLKRLAVDTLKIDRSFVGDLARDPDDAAIVAAVVTMAHSLGLLTVAEGVEDEETRRQLHALGCDHAQGYHFARPLPAAEITRLLSEAGLPHEPALAG
ncbi:putative bifunctional diguanylate cyclase/phosphodiesterase [Sphaerotilus microaerophilus]|uniref:putative bifunctional diguanylate cyclase/phosphodiesterase n=1 Tax=Sphaerotilus microaerophilus TaxID=2914710 RepID=UPI002073D376|nr:EAL domain-containing protein [Sphaerotilus sp. FB-5]